MNAFSPLPKLVFDDAIAFHTANHVFNVHADAANPTVLCLFFVGQLATTRLLLRLEDRDTRWGEALKSCVLPQVTSFRKVICFTISDALIMTLSFPCCAQTADATTDITDQNVLNRVLLLLSTVIQALFIRITRSIYRALCPIMEKKRVPFGVFASDSAVFSRFSPFLSS